MAIKLIDLKEREAALIELDDREAELDDREEDLHDREAELHDREAEVSSKEDDNVSKSMRLEAWQESLEQLASCNIRIVDPEMTVLRRR